MKFMKSINNSGFDLNHTVGAEEIENCSIPFHRQFQKILDDDTPPLPGEELLPAITSGDRFVC